MKKKRMRYVVTQFWTPRAGDGVYLFWTECRSLAHIRQKIDKSTEKNILFYETLFELFSALFILPLYYQNHQVFLGWSGVFIMLNSFFFIWSLRLNKSLRICTKKIVMLLSQFFGSNLGSDSDSVSYDIWPS
jgi:hypothetical protein